MRDGDRRNTSLGGLAMKQDSIAEVEWARLGVTNGIILDQKM